MANRTWRPPGFIIPSEVLKKASEDTKNGDVVSVTPEELIYLMRDLDLALDAHPGIVGTERERVEWVRSRLSDYFEDPARRRKRS